MKKTKNTKKGFTLIELLVVIAIIGILAAVTLSSLNTARAKARDMQKISTLRALAMSFEMHILDQDTPLVNGGYNCNGTGVVDVVYSGSCGSILDGLIGAGYLNEGQKEKISEISTTGCDSILFYGTSGGDQEYAIYTSLEGSQNSMIVNGKEYLLEGSFGSLSSGDVAYLNSLYYNGSGTKSDFFSGCPRNLVWEYAH